MHSLRKFKPITVFAACIASGMLILISAAGAGAQTQPDPEANSSQRAAGRISIDVEVTDKAGKPVVGLAAGDFTLLDNNRPTKLLDFNAVDAHGANAGQVRVVIVVDNLNTSFATVAPERQQLGEFLKQDGGQLAHPTSIAVLAESGLTLPQDSTQDGNALFSQIEKANGELRHFGTATGFYGESNRFQQSLDQFRQLIVHEAAKPGRKLIVFISPGWPLLSESAGQADLKERTMVFNSIEQFSTALRQSHVVLYNVDPREPGRGNPFDYQSYLKPVLKVNKAEYPYLGLQVMAEHTGGLAVVSSNNIKGEIDKAIVNASSYYTLTFESAPATEHTEYHALQVKAARPDVTVRTTAGYYVKGNQ